MQRDVHGHPLTTTAAGAEVWADALDRWLRLDGGIAAAVEHARRADPGLALAHAAAALLDPDGAHAPAAVAAAERAVAQGATDRERSFVAAVGARVRQGLWASEPAWRAHVSAFPGDLLAVVAYGGILMWSARPHALDSYERLYRDALRAAGDDPAVLAGLGMAAQERGRLDEAAALADRGLAGSPRSAPAAHIRGHVHLESGDHDAGAGWLASWRSGLPDDSPLAAHLAWHTALHHLALGDDDAVRVGLRRVTVAGVPEPAVLSDGSSLMWRCRLAGVEVPGRRAVRRVAAAAEGVARDPLTAFAGMHAALGLAATGRDDALARLGSHAVESSAPGVSDLVPPLVDALLALGRDRPARAADILLAHRPHWPRFGGSRAQREVLEDTLLTALASSGRTAEAAHLLQARLERRPHPRDAALLGAVAVPTAAMTTSTG